MLLSIIIPAYNAAKYLENCLDKLIVTSPYKYEVIAINDGSTDNTAQILASYSSKYDFITYIEQQNSGVSAARNTGLSIAKGKYITFVDADDELLDLPYILHTLSDSAYDLIIGNFHEIDADGTILRSRQLSEIINTSRNALDKELLGNYFLNTCWGKFYLNSIIKNYHIEFPIDIKMGEDLIFVLKYMKYVQSFHCISHYLYNYLQLDTGAVRRLRHQITPELIHNKVLCIREKNNYIHDNSLSDDIIASYYKYQLADTVSTVNMMLKSDLSLSEEYNSLRNLVSTPEIVGILSNSIKQPDISIKRKLIAFLYLHKFCHPIYIILKHKWHRQR